MMASFFGRSWVRQIGSLMETCQGVLWWMVLGGSFSVATGCGVVDGQGSPVGMLTGELDRPGNFGYSGGAGTAAIENLDLDFDGVQLPDPGGANIPSHEDIVAALQYMDSDYDGRSDYDELLAGGNQFDPLDGPDIDGDGILNGDDSEVDGDGIENGSDSDVDGDGHPNGNDDDVDGDGLEESEDDDDDGDGELDETDEDDDGDGEVDCDCEHGVCSAFGGLCFCDRGWHGDSCDEFHCRDVRNCNNGTCIGPNTCRCNAGWESVGNIPCAVFHCRELKECSGRGSCVGPNRCNCNADWQGLEDCSLHTCDRNPVVCDDGDPCTHDICTPTIGCSHDPACAPNEVCLLGDCLRPCQNTSACGPAETCRDGACQQGCFADAECSDGDACTSDSCDANFNCVHDPVVCSLFETCVRGLCKDSCDDDSGCGGTHSCVEGGCVENCMSQLDCAQNEVCEDGTCLAPTEEDGG